YSLGNLYYELERYQEAADSFQNATKQGMENGDLFFMLGMSFVQMEELTLAMPYLLRSVELNPEDGEALFQYGIVLARSGFYE
ncbi:tetratricopeptide repeat protein, partial [Staphylococcus aureus]|nr:tetratricopeptide repeat protein [Staphylococcus aureus]